MSTYRLLGVCFVLVAGLYGPVLAQDDDALRFGAHGGLAAGSFWNEHPQDVFSYGPRVDGQLGAWLHLRRSAPVDVQLGAMVVRQGAHQELVSREILVGYGEADLQLTYLQVPILARVPMELPVVHREVRLIGGPHLAMLLRARTQVRSRTLRPDQLHPGSGYPRRFDAGLTIGAELPILESPSAEWAIGTRYSLGLLRTGQTSGVRVEHDGSYEVKTSFLRNHVLTVGVTTWW